MQKIVIKNFGPIKDAEVDVKEILVLIGEQASGKSTIAKLIYFFKSVADEFFENFYKSDKVEYDLIFDVKRPIRVKFYDYFGSTFHLPDFSITYYYDLENGRYLTLSLGADHRLQPVFSKGFFTTTFKKDVRDVKAGMIDINNKLLQATDVREKLALEQDKIRLIQQLSMKIDDAFENRHSSRLYAIAGRESTVSYEATFEAYLEQSISSLLDENRKRTFKAKEKTVEEALMIGYLKEVRRVKEVFKKYGGTFRNILNAHLDDRDLAKNIDERISKILKGDYVIDQYGEKIVFEIGRHVDLKDASSGQKEVVRILQDLVLCVIEKQRALRVVEEPEAHLFPVAQKQLVEMLVYMRNMSASNQLIITTHSPYILTVMNNLLFASRVIAKNESLAHEVGTRIPKEFHIDPSIFAAYSLGQDQDAYCESVFNPETGVIKQNYLDAVSEMLGSDFNFLYRLHAKSFKKVDGNA